MMESICPLPSFTVAGNPDGSTTLEPHNPAHRCRHTLPGHWQVGVNATPPETSLLHKLLEGVFRGDNDAKEKADLLSEICGVAALGYANKLMQPRAVVLWGRRGQVM